MNNLAEKMPVMNPKCRRGLTHIFAITLLFSMTAGFGACAHSDVAVKTEEKEKGPFGVDIKALQVIGSDTGFSVDTINGQQPPKTSPVVINAQRTSHISVGGWAIDRQAQTAAGGVFINIDGKTDVPTSYGQDRSDVANVLKNPRYKQSGYAASIDTSTLGKGHHTLALKVLTADKKGYYEPAQKYDIEIQ